MTRRTLAGGVNMIRRGCIPLLAITSGFGNIAHAATFNFTMTLDGSQELPPVVTPASGSGTATLNTDTNQFSWNVTFSGLSAPQTAAHFHGVAAECSAAGVLVGLPLGSPIVGSATVTDQQETDIIAGRWYVNVHTSANPGGEIRGQVRPAPLADQLPNIPLGSLHIQLQPLATGLTAPNWGAHAPGDAARLFVTDQPGTLWAVNLSNGAKSVFLDVTTMVVPMGAFGPGSFDERGLLGVAFHPNYQTNGLLYTFTSEPQAGPADFTTQPLGVLPNCQTVIREWEVPDPGNPSSVVDPGSTRVLLRIDKPQFNHNGGGLNFGPDGMLYIALGDGGAADDKDGGNTIGHGCIGNGQNTMVALGKILRIDPQGTNSANGDYGIPADNPFVGQGGFLGEIFAYGFRNPFRFSFDSLTGDLYAGDVGQNDVEEVDLVTSGGNYGWRVKEGSFYFVPNGTSSGYVTNVTQIGPAGLIDPIAEYDHDDGISVIGGFVYHGNKIPPLEGRYVFGEFAQFFDVDGRVLWLDETDTIQEFQFGGEPEPKLFILGFGEDANGELYLMTNGTGVPSGTTGMVMRIITKTGDLDANGLIDIDDLFAVIAAWGPCPNREPCAADIDNTGEVDIDDLFLVIMNWSI